MLTTTIILSFSMIVRRVHTFTPSSSQKRAYEAAASTISGNYQNPRERNWLMDDFATADGNVVNPYETLNVKRGANRSDIRCSYLTLSKLYHPDALRFSEVLPENCSSLEEVREKWECVKLSYEILSDKKMRLKYDRHAAINDPDFGQAAIDVASWSVNSFTWGMIELGKVISDAAVSSRGEELGYESTLNNLNEGRNRVEASESSSRREDLIKENRPLKNSLHTDMETSSAVTESIGQRNEIAGSVEMGIPNEKIPQSPKETQYYKVKEHSEQQHAYPEMMTSESEVKEEFYNQLNQNVDVETTEKQIAAVYSRGEELGYESTLNNLNEGRNRVEASESSSRREDLIKENRPLKNSLHTDMETSSAVTESIGQRNEIAGSVEMGIPNEKIPQSPKETQYYKVKEHSEQQHAYPEMMTSESEVKEEFYNQLNQNVDVETTEKHIREIDYQMEVTRLRRIRKEQQIAQEILKSVAAEQVRLKRNSPTIVYRLKRNSPTIV